MNTHFGFDAAIRLLKEGKRVARAGWNGKGMYVYLQKGKADSGVWGFRNGGQPMPYHSSRQDGISISLFEMVPSKPGLPQLPCFVMRTASGSFVPGWLASQTDMLAEDWEVVS